MAESTGGSGGPAAEPRGSIKIEIRSARGLRQSLQDPLDLTVEITNISDQPLWLVGVLPGSDGFRYPRYVAQIDGPSGPVSLLPPEALDYGPSLQVGHFVQLAPGEGFDPQGEGFIPVQGFLRFKPQEPGRYRFRLCFDGTSSAPREWLGHTHVRHRSQVEKLVGQVPKVWVWSNLLEIEFY
jgi:hypothetical protein